jgi:2-polyprenyl-3-methyl-5-hydroxy-6-metoxy-1,4-benzoquinol methylase
MNKQRHNYEYDFDLSSNCAPANVVKLVGFNKNVLELGCGPGSITKVLKHENNCHISALELDSSAIEKARIYCDEINQADFNDPNWTGLVNGNNYDVVIAADVLEHLYNPSDTLNKMASLISDDGYLVISLPHVGHASIMACLLAGDFAYQDWGLLDRTHIRFFCLRNMDELFINNGLKIIDVAFVQAIPEQTEFADIWSKLTDAQKKVLSSPVHSNVYQVVVKAVPVERNEPAISLVSAIGGDVSHETKLSLRGRAWITKKLSPESKQKIRSLMSTLKIKV